LIAVKADDRYLAQVYRNLIDGGREMQIPAEITWHNMEHVPHAQKRVNDRVKRLEKLFDRITRCHVVVEAPHQRQRQGNQYEVRVDVTAPGGELSVNRNPGDRYAHTDLLVAIRDAFDAMEHQLRRWKDQHTGRPEATAAPFQGRIDKIDPDAGSGQIATTDGRLVYFHRNSVVGGKFDALAEGDTVELVVDRGQDAVGAHASTVRPIGSQRFIDQPG
jgi:ribosomal subunit interface protein